MNLKTNRLTSFYPFCYLRNCYCLILLHLVKKFRRVFLFQFSSLVVGTATSSVLVVKTITAVLAI